MSVVSVVLENGEKARIYYGKFREKDIYFCEAVLVSKSGVYSVVSPPIKSEEKAELIYGMMLTNKVLPMNLCGMCEDILSED